ncbi:MAG: sigma-70 family RNA polymerase sigma factor [Cyclobacteriaceae bacterium]|nr:sigma-70 family RNA polymerase sigma factor [Cyclobacteriaceae bacterium]
MNQDKLIPHLFRTEFRNLASALTQHFGIAHLQAAEDIASETFLAALESWSYKGLPENPKAWLYRVAKNKAVNYQMRNQVFTQKITPQLKSSSELFEIDLSEKQIHDSQLQMLFALCHPAIPPEAQVGLSLRMLCGFGIEEIATAFLTNKETIYKRLYRAKEKLREINLPIEMPPGAEIDERLQNVLLTLYLLFNEGYYSESNEVVLREEFCLEAMRLTYLLIENSSTNQPTVNALMALMCFHASRFAARKNASGELLLYDEQDESLWNQELIARGAYYFRQAASGNKLSRYHLEAGIAYWHTQKKDTHQKWENILQLYNQLLQLNYSPVAALNRTFALAKANSYAEAIKEAEKLQLTDNLYYFLLLGELYSKSNKQQSEANYKRALALAKTPSQQIALKKKLDALINAL